MEYRIGEVSSLSGVSGRTLRYYDEIGLLCPGRMNEAGYRFYGEEEIDLLQQILFYRARGFSLEQIKNIVYDEEFDLLHALFDHLETLESRKEQLERLITTVKKTISETKGEGQMKNEEKFQVFKEKMIEESEALYGQEARQKYGAEAVNGAQKELRQMTGEKFQRLQTLEQEILEKLQEAVRSNTFFEAPLGQEIANLHKEWITLSWGEERNEAHLGVVELYVIDERFAGYYDREVLGCAKFLRDAVVYWLG